MYTKLNRMAVVLIATVTISSCLSSCSPADTTDHNGITVTKSLQDKPVLVGNIPCEFPLVHEDSSLNIVFSGYDNVKAEDVYVWQQYQEMTGVSVNWTTTQKSEREQLVSNVLMNKTDVDLIFRCALDNAMLTKYGAGGYILDLSQDNLLQENAPNCWAYLQSHPDALASVTNPDGSIYSLPQINSGAELRVARKLFINKNWLANVQMEVPTTTEELYQLLLAFKEQDANGNGDLNDEIPLCLYDWASLQDAFFGAFGLSNRGKHNQIVDCNEETGGVRLIASSEDYRCYLEYLNRLYTEGLLDNNVFTITSEQWIANASLDRIGVFASTNLATLPSDKADNWVAIDTALTGPNGDNLWAPIRANFHSPGAAVIPSTCEDPALVLRWLDYFWTDEGTLFYHMGIEGETFVANEDGSYDYAPALYDQINSGSQSFDDIIATYSPYPGGSNPTVEIAPYFRGGEMATVPAQAARSLFLYGPTEYWPSFTFTAEENSRLDIIQYDINKYTSEARIAFVSGKKPFSEWDSYKEQLHSLGEDELLDIYQAAVDRYAKLEEGLQDTP